MFGESSLGFIWEKHERFECYFGQYLRIVFVPCSIVCYFLFQKRYAGYKGSMIGIESSQIDENKKEENTTINNFDEEKQEKTKI